MPEKNPTLNPSRINHVNAKYKWSESMNDSWVWCLSVDVSNRGWLRLLRIAIPNEITAHPMILERCDRMRSIYQCFLKIRLYITEFKVSIFKKKRVAHLNRTQNENTSIGSLVYTATRYNNIPLLETNSLANKVRLRVTHNATVQWLRARRLLAMSREDVASEPESWVYRLQPSDTCPLVPSVC